MSSSPPNGFLVWNEEDQFCINLNHDIKVFFKANNSLMVKNYADNNCFAVAGKLGIGSISNLFTLQRDGIKIHRASDDDLHVEVIRRTPPKDEIYTAKMFMVDGDCKLVHKMTDKFQSKFMTCDEVFNYNRAEAGTINVRERALMLQDSFYYCRNSYGDLEIHVENGISIYQEECGHTRVNFLLGGFGRLSVNPNGNMALDHEGCQTASTDEFLLVRRGEARLYSKDRIVEPVIPDRRRSC